MNIYLIIIGGEGGLLRVLLAVLHLFPYYCVIPWVEQHLQNFNNLVKCGRSGSGKSLPWGGCFLIWLEILEFDCCFFFFFFSEYMLASSEIRELTIAVVSKL